MKIDKKDLPKVVILAVLFAGALVYCFTQMGGTTTTAKAASPPTAAGGPGTVPVAGTAAGSQPVSAPGPGQPLGPDASFDPTQLSSIVGGKDPFVPNGPAAPRDPALPPVPVKVAAGTPAPIPAVSVVERPKPGGIAGFPPFFGGGPGNGGSPSYAPVQPIKAVELPPPPAPNYAVTGVVLGNGGGAENVAILRDGEERRFVRVGDSVGNDFVVSAILFDGVEIRSGERRVILKIGGDSRAK